ncbi:MAG: hypothetical protein ACLFQM_10860 [Fidelibacterota bacterium]
MRNIYLKGILFLVVLSMAASLLAQTPIGFRGKKDYRRIGTMDGNLVLTKFKNYGEVTDYPNEPSCNWPSYGKHYCDGVAVIVSVEVENGDGELIHPMETQYREFVDKSPDDVPWGFEPRPFWFNMDAKENKIPAMSNEPLSWPKEWMDKPDSWNGYWNGYFGKGIMNADLETVFVFDDDADKEPNIHMNFYCDENDSTRGGIGLVVKTRAFQWSHVLAEDCIFWLYNIENESTHDYEKTYYAQYLDWGVGGVEDGADDIGEYDTNLDLAYAYDTDGYGTPGNWSPVGYAGYAFLESPGIADDNIDNDNDGITDEKRYSDGPGEYLDEYPYGFSDEDREKFYAHYLRYPSAHWENDEDCDWVGYTDLNANGKWDDNEPLNDDLGEDGVGPFDAHYTGPDIGEGDGRPTNGEPNYNETDPDESDQIGLTGFEIFPVHKYELTNDEENWGVFSKAPLPMDQILQPNNLGMFFSSGSFPLYAGERERYSMALLFGEDRDDLVKNKRTVQQIYNADYRFSKPPAKPNLTVYPGDGEITLVWDDVAEDSYDPFLQEYDFEGYMIYKSTEAQFLENKVITDAYGNATFQKPVKQFDLKDGKKGPHPIDIYGVKFNLGEDTGLKHSWTDTDVKNGQKYYYAIVSYDYGLVSYTSNSVEGIAPSTCSAIIKTNPLGEVTFMDINTGVATPRPAAAGYIAPHIDGEVDHVGPATGHIELSMVEKHKVPSGKTTFEVEFFDSEKYHTDVSPYYNIRNVLADTLVLDSVEVNEYGGDSPFFYGSVVSVFNDTTISMDREKTKWIEGESDYDLKVRLNPDWENVAGFRLNLNQPADYEIEFHDSIVHYSNALFGLKSYPSNVSIFNKTDSVTVNYSLVDNDKNKKYSHGDDLVIVVPDDDFVLKNYFSWMLRFDVDYEIDSTNGYNDTTWITTDPPQPGDKMLLAVKKPFRGTTYKMVFDTVNAGGGTVIDTNYVVDQQGDVFRFTLQGADSSNTLAKQELDDICVVPNPYVVTASWEPKNPYKFGRGERRIQFFHLPRECTIRIYSLRGFLVDTIEHRSTADNGMESWDLISKDGNDIAYGIYIYHVEVPGIGEKIGRFVVIK